LDGGYLNTFRLEDQSEKAYQLIVNKSGDIIMAGSYLGEHMINVYDSSWNKIASYFPRKEELANMMLTRTTYNSLGFYNGGVFVTNYFDPTIYHIRDNGVKPLVRFDFGSNNLPEDFFTFTPEEQLSKFTTYRENSVMGISNLTVTDDWIIFSPEEGPAPFIVFYDRKQNRYMTNQNLDIPYSLFFGKWNNAPKGYTEAGQYYSTVNIEELREIKEAVARKEKDDLSRYEFLNGIVHSTISEGDNPWLVFYSLK
jgi:hypothetical protein